MHHLIAPSVLAADFGNLQAEIEMLNQSQADWVHCDIMDGRFVPNISFGIPVLEAIKRNSRKPLDVHLMIVEPQLYLSQMAKAGAEVITVHLEACTHLHRVLQEIKNLGCIAGVALNPHTPVSQLEDVLAEVEVVCLMSVNPGFGGQTFIPETYGKIKKLRALIQEQNSKALIQIDGGVNLNNASLLLQAGAEVLVAGSFVFSSADPLATIEELKSLNA
ncbi:ribulose-phosphate 3-epimerase [soil metagenome]